MYQKGFGTAGIVLVLGIVVLAGGALFTLSSPDEPTTNVTNAEPAPDQVEALPVSDDNAAGGTMLADDPRSETMSDEELAAGGGAEPMELTETDENVVDNTEGTPDIAVEAGTYEAYSPEKLTLAETGTVVLFFHADWCPSCRALESDINANLSAIPSDMHILKVDYDTATELKQQYGITRQHTLVEVDETGAEVQTLTGLTNTLDQVVAQL